MLSPTHSNCAFSPQVMGQNDVLSPQNHVLTLPLSGSFFYLTRDWRTQNFRLNKQESRRAIVDLPLVERLSYEQYTALIHPDDVVGFQAMESRWKDIVTSQSALLAHQYHVNFDYRLLANREEPIRVLHQIIQLTFDEAGTIRYSIERCTDISVWKQFGGKVLSVWKSDMVHPHFFYPDRTPPGLASLLLTKTEKKVVKLLIEGSSSKQIASDLGMAFNTVNTHRRNILRKTKAKNTVELVKCALHDS